MPLGSGALCHELPQELSIILRNAGPRSNQRAWARIRPRLWLYPRALLTNYDRNKGIRHFLAFYDLESDRLYGRFTARKTAVQWLAFLESVRRATLRPHLHIVLDNYATRITFDVVTWAWAHDVKFYMTPTNASWLNRIECQFAAMKAFAMKPSNFRTHDELQQAIESYLLWYNGHRPISCQPWNHNKTLKGYKNHQQRAKKAA